MRAVRRLPCAHIAIVVNREKTCTLLALFQCVRSSHSLTTATVMETSSHPALFATNSLV